MKTIENLKAGDFIAFGFDYHGGKATEIMVSNITEVSEHGILCHFLYGHHSLAEYVKKDEIIAIGNENGKRKISGWSGNFDVVNRTHSLIKKVSKIK